MVCGIGIDIIEIERMRRSFNLYGDKLLERLFTPDEIEYASRKNDGVPSLAVRFAAKEALTKALNVGKRHVYSWLDATVTLNEMGCPLFIFTEKLDAHLAGNKVHLSLSHSDSYASAIVVIEKLG